MSAEHVNTAYPKWKPTRSKQEKNGVEGDDDEKVIQKIYVHTDPDDDGGAMGEPFALPVSDYDYAINPAGGVVTVVLSTNRVDSRKHCDSNYPALQKEYKRGKGFVFYPDVPTKITDAEGKKRTIHVPMSAGTTVEQWLEANKTLLEQRKAKHLKSSTRNVKDWLPPDQKMAQEIMTALKAEAENIATKAAEAAKKK